MDRRKLINVLMENGDIVPIVNAEELEMVVDGDGCATIKLKEKK